MAELKQVVISMVIVLIAAGILAGMVMYTVAILRTAQQRILTGEQNFSIGHIRDGEWEDAWDMQAPFAENC